MTIKQWLMRARSLESRIAALQDSRRRAYGRAISSIARPREIYLLSGGVCEAVDQNASYVLVGDEVRRQEAALNRVRVEILQACAKVEDNVLSALLIEYYVNGKTWEQVADAIHYSYSQTVKHKHGEALDAVEHAIQCHSCA